MYLKEMKYLQGLAKERKAVIPKNVETEVSAIYLRVVRRAEELRTEWKKPNRATGSMKRELALLFKAKMLAEGLVLNDTELRHLRELAAQKAEVLEVGVEQYISTIYRRVYPRLMKLKGIDEAEKKISGPAQREGGAAKKEPGLIDQEIGRLAESKRLVDDIVTTGLNGLFYEKARRMCRPKFIADLVQEAKTVFIDKVMPKFDPTRGYRLSTYGNWWIIRTMEHYIYNHAKDIRCPAYVYRAMNNMRRASKKHRNQTGEEPTIEDIKKSTGLASSVIATCMKAPDTISMNSKLPHVEGEKLIDRIPDTRNADPLDAVLDTEKREIVYGMLANLTPRYEKLMRMRHGIGCKEHTLEAIGKDEHVTKERIRQLLLKAMKKLRLNSQKLPHGYCGDTLDYEE